MIFKLTSSNIDDRKLASELKQDSVGKFLEERVYFTQKLLKKFYLKSSIDKKLD